jgi:P4 family phage/plasmid primase-like protien
MSSHPKTSDVPMNSKFQRFLLKHLVPKGNAFTHTSLGKPLGSFYIPGETLNEFYRIYTEALEVDEDIFLTEKHRHISPILIDLDFRFALHGEVATRKYTQEHIDRIVEVYCDHICELFEPDMDKVLLMVMEKKNPQIVQKRIKDGVHIVIPRIVSKPSAQYVLRTRVMKDLGTLFEEMGATNKVEDIVDEAVIERNNWLMYGSKKPGGEAYELTRVFELTVSDGTIVDVSDDYADISLLDLVQDLSIRNKHDEVRIRVDAMKEINEYEKILEGRRKKMETAKHIITDQVNKAKNECQNIEEVNALVDIMSEERANNYNDWIRVGWCLRNIDYRLLDKWIDFSRKSPKYKDGECDMMWDHMKSTGLGIGSLHMWAKQDNPTRYAEIVRSSLRRLIYESKTGTHNDVARVIYEMYKYEYVCASIKYKAWYEFREHRWHSSDSAFSLRIKMSNEVWREYVGAARDFSQRAMDATNPEDQERFHDYAQKLHGIATKLKITSFKDNVMKECCEMFYIEKFEERLDSNLSLIGFENGVFDMDTMEFREGRPEDYITFSTKNNYVAYDPSHHHVGAIRTYLSQVFTRPAVREYVMKLLATFLHGIIKEQKFYLWTGSGCHAYDADIMMADGSIKKVQDVALGDQLMGDDSTPRNVLKLCRGFGDMYRIVPKKGESFIVNGDHIMSLKTTSSIISTLDSHNQSKPYKICWLEWKEPLAVNRCKNFATEEESLEFKETLYTDKKVVKSGDIIDIELRTYLANVKRVGERYFNLYRPDLVEFPDKEVDIDPYVLGAWLGDGSSDGFAITGMDHEIIDYVKEHIPNCKLKEFPKKDNKASLWHGSKIEGRKKEKNDMVKALEKYNLIKNKHIPYEYLHNSREKRLQVLAGIIDTDGTYQKSSNQFIVTMKSKVMISDIQYLARSLGYACYMKAIEGKCCNNGKIGTYYQVNIVGEHLMDIPTLLPRKRAHERVKNKDVRRVGFSVERVEDGNFYGFELDGNHRYLDGGIVVFHNSNSKSKIIELFEKSFGDYCCKFPVTMLTQKRVASNAATSEMARAKGKRFACLQEPSEDEKFNVGYLKEITGGDKIMARALFKEPIEFTPQFKLILCCNHLPSVPSDDGGTWRRIRVVEFTSKFVENPVEENEFPIDLELSQKLEDWKEMFFAMLLEYYKLYRVEGIQEPEEVLSCTRDYKRQNDHIADFLANCVEKKDSFFLSLNDVFAELKIWAKEDNVQMKIPTKSELEKYLSKNLCKCVNGNNLKGFKGHRLKSRNQIIEEVNNVDGIDA